MLYIESLLRTLSCIQYWDWEESRLAVSDNDGASVILIIMGR